MNELMTTDLEFTETHDCPLLTSAPGKQGNISLLLPETLFDHMLAMLVASPSPLKSDREAEMKLFELIGATRMQQIHPRTERS